MVLRDTAFRDPKSYFRRFVSLSDTAALDRAGAIRGTTNGPNLVDNNLPTRGRATPAGTGQTEREQHD